MLEIGLKFNSVFYEANRAKDRYRILYGGAGSGKSLNVAQDFILKLMDAANTGANLLVVRKAESANRNSTFAELCGAAERICGSNLKDIWRIKTADMEMRCLTTGNRIIFCGFNDAKQREKIKSVSFSKGKLVWVWVEEATEITEDDLNVLDDRLRGDLKNNNLYYQITMTFNPVSSRHWIKKRFFDNKYDSVFICRSTYLDNAFIDEAYHRRMEERKKYDPKGYAVYALGEWGEVEGLVLPHYEVSEFEVDFDSSVLGQDFGFNHANAILAVGFKEDEIYVYDEMYLFGKDTAEIAAFAEGRFSKALPMYCDSAEPDRIKMWKRAGFNALPVKKGPNSVAAQIDYLKQRRIVIMPRCVNLIGELQDWRWEKDMNGEYIDSPAAGRDDAIAALRYAVNFKVRQEGIGFLR